MRLPIPNVLASSTSPSPTDSRSVGQSDRPTRAARIEPAQAVDALTLRPRADRRRISRPGGLFEVPAVGKPARIAVDGRDAADHRKQRGVILMFVTWLFDRESVRRQIKHAA